MTKYRIVPFWIDRWTVEQQFRGFFWKYATSRDFATESAAEEWIRTRLSLEAQELAERKAIDDRRKRYVPRVYP